MDTRNIEDVYPLSPLQAGMLFHSLYAPTSSVYSSMAGCTLQGPLDIEAFEQAWQCVVDRHTILRTAFVWKSVDKPLQVVHRRVKLPLEQQDWRGFSPAEQQERLETLWQAECERGFDLSRAPLMRLTLLQTAKDTYHFAWSLHHILIDGWSFTLLLNQVFACYQAFHQGEKPSLLLARPYRDYIAWLQQQDMAKAEAYWRQMLQGFTASTPLVVDCLLRDSADSEKRYDQGLEETQLSAQTTAALQSLAKQHHLTLNTIVQGAWALLLSRYSGEQDVVFGVTASGRSAVLEGMDSMIGLFMNTLPVRVQVPSDALLLPWLGQLQAQQAETRQYEYSPLVQVQGWSEIPRGQPLFESIVVFENHPTNISMQEQDESLQIHDVRIVQTTNYPITVASSPAVELPLVISYDRRRFEAATIRRMLGHFQALLEGIAADPQQPISQLPLLTLVEQHQLQVEWDSLQVGSFADRCVHQLFEIQVERAPDAIAVSFEGEALSYEGLNAHSNHLAHRLQRLGLEPGQPAAILFRNGPLKIIALLGILKAGGMFVCLDLAHPLGRTQQILQDVGPACLISESACLNDWGEFWYSFQQETSCQMLVLDRDDINEHASWGERLEWKDIPSCFIANLDITISASDPVYVVYTSGSTGRPKGILQSQGSLGHLVQWFGQQFQLQPSQRVAQWVSITFDPAYAEIFGALSSGATLCLINASARNDPAAVADWVKQEAIGLLQIVPSFSRSLLEVWSAREAKGAGHPCPHLASVLLAGEALPPDLMRAWLERFPHHPHFFNVYGPTEAIVATCYSVEAITPDQRIIPIGRAIAGCQILILDKQQRLCPVGVKGELYIRGLHLALGYWQRPEETQRAFIQNPLHQDYPDRVYRTGDQARYLPDGNIEFLGRLDYQVKIRGFRVEPGEIEAALVEHPSVREAVVTDRQDHSGRKQLVAYVVPERDVQRQEPRSQDTLVQSLQGHLKAKLPDYMIPAVFVTLAEGLPLTPNGKIDRKALPALQESLLKTSVSYTPPRDDTEKTLAEIWVHVLGLEQVGVHDNFFELGGDSIVSIQVIAKANQAGIHLTPKDIFDHPTIAQLARLADAAVPAEIIQDVVMGEVPLTPIQHWFLKQSWSEPYHFNQAVFLQVQRAIDPMRLEQSLRHLLEQHDALRLRYEKEGTSWRQINAGLRQAVPFVYVDLSALAEGEQSPVMEAAAAELQGSLNLLNGPLMYMAWFELGMSRSARLLIIVHHLAVDGVSWRILLEDLQAFYQQLERGKAIEQVNKTTSFKHWAEKLTAYAQSEIVQQELAVWLDQPWKQVLPLPVDRPGGANTTELARHVSVWLSEAETEALLREVPQAYRTRINDVLLTALVMSFAEWSGKRVLLLDLEGHGREHAFDGVDLSRTVGWFTFQYPVLLDLGETKGPGEALKSIKEQLRRIPHNGFHYGLLRYLTKGDCSKQLQGLPQAQVGFNYLGQFDQVLSRVGLFVPAQESSGPECSREGSHPHLLEISGKVAGGQLGMDWIYSEGIYERATVEAWANSFLKMLQGLIAHCRLPEAGGFTPSDFPLADLDQAQLDYVSSHCRFIQDLYPASPMQESMLSHALYDTEWSVGFEQQSFRLHGELDVVAFKRAWQQVVNRHPILRTAFLWAHVNRPLQVVYPEAQIPWDQQDWQGESWQEQQMHLEAYLHTDRRQGFDMSCAPLMRLALIQLANDDYQFVWSIHHILVDGWCRSLIIREVVAFYNTFHLGQDLYLADPPSYRDYIAWLQRQDLAQAETFWRRILSGFTAPTLLQVARPTMNGIEPSEFYQAQDTLLSPATTDALQVLIRREQLTLNTVVQGAWALLLSYYSGQDDIVFGIAVSGRPPNLPYMDSIIGLFINNLPVRVRLDPCMPVWTWLKRLQDEQVELRQYEYTPLVQVRQWSDVPWSLPLFESLFIFQNYPQDHSFPDDQSSQWVIEAGPSMFRTGYPLTLAAAPGPGLWLCLTYDSRRFDAAVISQMLSHLRTLLKQMANTFEQSLASLSFLTAVERQQLADAGLCVLNAHQQPVPNGVAGELYVQSLDQARIELACPDMIAGPAIPHPFSAEPGATLYGTGKLARFRMDDQVELLGDMDSQVKIHGYCVVLADIEMALNQHPYVLTSAVMMRNDLPFSPDQKNEAGTGLVAYIVARNGQLPTNGELRKFIKQQLVNPVLPSVFVFVDALPRTSQGRIDYSALPPLDPSRSRSISRNYSVANDALEVLLTCIWEQVLGIHPVDVNDSFFDLGGNSILALHLVVRIKRQIGHEIPLATLFEGTTIRRMATLLRQDAKVLPWSALVPIKSFGSRYPFFCVHPAGGSILGFVDLARYLDPEQPFYGLQSIGLDGQREPYTSLEEMAAHYTAEIRSVQPEGPYALGGFSFGGFVAFEIAQQLVRAGQSVGLLAMLDTWSPRFQGKPTQEFDSVGMLMYFVSRLTGQHGHVSPFLYDKFKLLEPDEQIDRALEYLHTANAFYPGVGPIEMRRLVKLQYSNAVALQNYTPQVYPGRITLFRATILDTDDMLFAQHPARHRPDRGWQELTPQPVEVHLVPGEHSTIMFDPHVRDLAKCLTACLNQVQGLGS